VVAVSFVAVAVARSGVGVVRRKGHGPTRGSGVHKLPPGSVWSDTEGRICGSSVE
jgi:hypothetical protein